MSRRSSARHAHRGSDQAEQLEGWAVRHDVARDGTARWAKTGAGERIGEGWNSFARILSGQDGVLYGVTPDGFLFFYRDLARAERHGNSGDAKTEIAERHGLRVVRGKIPVPDLRIEYETREGDTARVNLELVTEHYRGRQVADKVHAGFSLYTPHGEADHLRRVLDQHELTAEILSL